MPTNKIKSIMFTGIDLNPQKYVVGESCDEIKETEKYGEYSMIPYLEVYKDGKILASFCLHKVEGVFYNENS